MKSFIALIVLLFVFLGFIGLGLRQKGLNQSYSAFNHPLSAFSNMQVIYPRESKTTSAWSSWDALNWAEANSPNQAHVLVWLDVQRTGDGHLIVYKDDFVKDDEGKSQHLAFWSWQKISALKKITIKDLKETLLQYPNRNLVLNVMSNTKEIDKEIIAAITATQAEQRIIINSPFEFVLKSLRQHQPSWYFAVGLAQFTRLAMFADVGLAPVVPISGDILILPATSHRQLLSPEIARELQRRKKKVIKWPEHQLDSAVDGTINPTLQLDPAKF